MTSPSVPPLDSTADRALRQMGHTVVPVESAERQLERRGRLVPSLSAFAGAAIEARRRRRFWMLAIAVAAAVALLSGAAIRVLQMPKPSDGAVASVRARAGEVRVGRAGATAGPIGTTRVDLLASDRVETVDSRAEVNLKSGALIELDSRTRLDLGPDVSGVERQEERLEVSFGKISVRVPKLPKGHTLSVGTPNATVTVHGTAFDVIVQKGAGNATTTAVAVREGRVSVESDGREIVLGPGSSWSSAAGENAVTANPETAASAGVPASSSSDAVIPAPAVTRPGVARSTLARENALFRAAIEARQSGDAARAIRLLDQLIVQFPDTPLAGAAKEERARATSERAHGGSN